MIRIFGAYKDFPEAFLSEQEAEHFLTSDKRIVHIGTVDNSGGIKISNLVRLERMKKSYQQKTLLDYI